MSSGYAGSAISQVLSETGRTPQYRHRHTTGGSWQLAPKGGSKVGGNWVVESLELVALVINRKDTTAVAFLPTWLDHVNKPIANLILSLLEQPQQSP